jgi:homospermidine synthase
MSFTVPSFTKDFDGPIIMIGFGSIGKATLPLIKRHLVQKETSITVISPDDSNRKIAEYYGATFLHGGLTKENYEAVLTTILAGHEGRAFIVNVSNEVCSKDITLFAAKNNTFYIDTVVEPWPGFYFNNSLGKAEQSNYALRETLHEIKAELVNTPTAISCCGANPGMVSWLVKEALLNIANEIGFKTEVPQSREEWATLMKDLKIKGVHIAEKDTQVATFTREPGVFVNTWSGAGCIAECLQPAELGWGTNEKELPSDGHHHQSGCKAAIYLDAPGGNVKVRTWTPTAGSHFGFLVTHNEAISISDYFTLKENNQVTYRPTCHYSYRPSDATVESLEELFEKRNGLPQTQIKIIEENEVVSGADELGVLLYGHENGAYWYGSTLTIEEARKLAPHQNATGMQVASAVLAGMFYAIDHPEEGLIEADEMDYAECLNIQKGYLGKISGHFTNWSPRDEIEIDIDEDPWQFSNIRITK